MASLNETRVDEEGSLVFLWEISSGHRRHSGRRDCNVEKAPRSRLHCFPVRGFFLPFFLLPSFSIRREKRSRHRVECTDSYFTGEYARIAFVRPSPTPGLFSPSRLFPLPRQHPFCFFLFFLLCRFKVASISRSLAIRYLYLFYSIDFCPSSSLQMILECEGKDGIFSVSLCKSFF